MKALRHLIPRASAARWSGSALPDDTHHHDMAEGFCLCLQWLGLIIEIGTGRVHSTGGKHP